MSHWQNLPNVERAFQALSGIAAGIALDYHVSDGEVAALVEWLDLHSGLVDRPPFNELADLLARILEDGVIDDDERDELLEWCQAFADEGASAVACASDSVRRLHGVLHGLASDGELSDQELVDLNDWLYEHEDVWHVWPFCDLKERLDSVLGRGEPITDSERAELLAFCSEFAERPANAIGLRSLPVVHAVSHVCNHSAPVSFAGKRFCFTGKARLARKELARRVEALGAVVVRNVSNDLDFLVIGALSQPAWAYASYGRKIEAVLERKQRTAATTEIVHEDAVLAAMLAAESATTP